MFKRTLVVLFIVAGLILPGAQLWAYDDSMMDVDNHSAAFVGDWGYSTNKILYYGDDYRYAYGGGGTKTATWTTNEYTDGYPYGYWKVFARWTTASNRYTAAVYNVYEVTSTGQTYRGSCTVNQQTNGGEWRYCTTV